MIVRFRKVEDQLNINYLINSHKWKIQNRSKLEESRTKHQYTNKVVLIFSVGKVRKSRQTLLDLCESSLA